LTRTSCYSVFKDQPGSIPKLLRNGSLPLTTVTCQDRMFLTFFLPPPGGSTTYTPHPISMSRRKPQREKIIRKQPLLSPHSPISQARSELARNAKSLKEGSLLRAFSCRN
jgi:hypothetical protein